MLQSISLVHLEGQSNIYSQCVVPSDESLSSSEIWTSASDNVFRITFNTDQKSIRIKPVRSKFAHKDDDLKKEILAIDVMTMQPLPAYLCLATARPETSELSTACEKFTLEFRPLSAMGEPKIVDADVLSIKTMACCPYKISHLFVRDGDGQTTVPLFIVACSEQKFHAFKLVESVTNKGSKSVDVDEISDLSLLLPELAVVDHSEPVISYVISYLESESNFERRLTALGLESGLIILHLTARQTQCQSELPHYAVECSWQIDDFTFPVAQLSFFVTVDKAVQLLAVNTLHNPIVFNNVAQSGLSSVSDLPYPNDGQMSGEVFTSGIAIDIDVDSILEVIVGTSNRKIYIYKEHETQSENLPPTWCCMLSISVCQPVLQLMRFGRGHQLVVRMAESLSIIQDCLCS